MALQDWKPGEPMVVHYELTRGAFTAEIEYALLDHGWPWQWTVYETEYACLDEWTNEKTLADAVAAAEKALADEIENVCSENDFEDELEEGE